MIKGNHQGFEKQVDKGLFVNNIFLFHNDYQDDKMISFLVAQDLKEDFLS